MKININREIEIPDSLFCKKCKALREYEVESSGFRAATCANFNDTVFAKKYSGWYFLKCHACINAVLDYMGGYVEEVRR